ncbi:hypothetical protein GCM10009557_19620 [Virgisporangium ochraceum]
MPPPHGFDYTTRGDGAVVITHHGRPATTLRGPRGAEFLAEVDSGPGDGSDQEVMARWTGNYRHGNERQARNHPRNQGR